MDRQINQALTSMIPSFSGPLPPELLELSGSLLAQSRNKASNLKAEEEIARLYACANIACERLKQHLALPKIEPRPPCPPRVYKKLYGFLDSALPSAARKKRRTSQNAPTSTGRSSQHIRPDISAKSSISRKGKEPDKASTPDLPTWIMPVIRQISKNLGAPAAPHHVFAGVSSIFSSNNRPVELNIIALMITLFLLVLTRLAGVETNPTEYSQRKQDALAAVKQATTQNGERLECDEATIDEYMRQVNKYQWTEMDWFGNVVVGSGFLRQDDHSTEADLEDDDADDDESHILPKLSEKDMGSFFEEDEDYLQAGLGTMMDDRVDYSSDARRQSFERWKRETLHRIDELEARDQAAGRVES